MKSIHKEQDCDRILIVEGYSDLLFYAAFLEHLGRLEGLYIKEFKGRSEVLKRETLETYLSPKRLAEKKSIAIIVDGDFNPAGAAESLKSSLHHITERKVEEAAWNSGSPNLGYFIVPDPSTPGEIETLVWNTWSSHSTNQLFSEEVMRYLRAMSLLGCEPKSPDKGKLGAFLAVRCDEDPRLGPGARENLFDFDAPGFQRLKHFLQGL